MQYYLFKNGLLSGPYSEEKIEELKKSKKYFDYQWIIDSESQHWKTISAAPSENPFQMAKKHMKDRSLSAAFMISTKPFSGEIKNIHSFGVEVVIKGMKKPLRELTQKRSVNLNLCDETHLTFVNAKALPQSQEMLEDGLHIVFNWDQQGVVL